MVDSIGNSLNAQIASSSPLLGSKAPGNLEASDGPGNMIGSFGELLKNSMADISKLQQQADQAAETYAVGGDIELHNVILASEKAETAMQLALQIRNRLVAAYQEVSHMQI